MAPFDRGVPAVAFQVPPGSRGADGASSPAVANNQIPTMAAGSDTALDHSAVEARTQASNSAQLAHASYPAFLFSTGSNPTERLTPAEFASSAHSFSAPFQMPYANLPSYVNPLMVQMPPAAMRSQRMVAAPQPSHTHNPYQGGYEPLIPNNHTMSVSELMGASLQMSRVAVPSHNNYAMMAASYHDATLMPDNTTTLAAGFHDTMTPASGETNAGSVYAAPTPVPNALPAITTTEDLKPLLRQRLPRDQPGSLYKGYIRGAADFEQQSRLYQSLSNKTPGSADDFPQDDASLEMLAKGLTDAMTNIEDAVEAGKKSVARIYQLSLYEIELKSWNMLFILRDVQLGKVDLHLWGAEWEIENFDTFIDRYEDVKDKLQMSKSLVSSLFDQKFGIRLALSPGSELKKKLANSKNNSRRATELASIRKQKKRGLEASDEGEGEEEEETGPAPGVSGGRPTKRRRGGEAAATMETPSSGKEYEDIQDEDFHVEFNFDEDFLG